MILGTIKKLDQQNRFRIPNDILAVCGIEKDTEVEITCDEAEAVIRICRRNKEKNELQNADN